MSVDEAYRLIAWTILLVFGLPSLWLFIISWREMRERDRAAKWSRRYQSKRAPGDD